MKRIEAVAHTGCMGTPMNSMKAVREAVNWKTKLIEVDVRFSEDGKAVLTHNPIEVGKEYVSLKEALEEIKKTPKIFAALDLKEWSGHMTGLVQLLQECGMIDRCVYLGNFMEDMGMMVKEGGGVPCFPNVYPEQVDHADQEELEALAWKIKEKQADAVGMNFKAVRQEFVEALHRQEIAVSVWTVDQTADMERMQALGVDFITTNRPDLLSSVIGRKTD